MRVLIMMTMVSTIMMEIDRDLSVVEYFYFDLQTLVAADRVLKEVPVKN